MTSKDKENDSALKERADRVREVRENILRLSRADIKKKYGISVATLQGWEDPRFGNLTHKGAKRLVKAYQQEGLQLTVEWLMYGVGTNPLASYRISEPDSPTYQVELPEPSAIAQEVQLFHKNNRNAIDMIVSDDAMEPYLTQSDHVAGKRFFAEDMEKAIGYSCIIQTQAGVLLVRQLQRGREPGLYTLVAVNPEFAEEGAILENIELFSAAPIIWIRKKSISA